MEKFDYSIVLELVINNGFLNFNNCIKIKSVSKNFNRFSHLYMLSKSNNFSNELLKKPKVMFNYFESNIIVYPNPFSQHIYSNSKCDICGDKIKKVTSLFNFKYNLCEFHIKMKFIILSDVIKKYKIPRKLLGSITRWKHFKKNKILFYKHHIKTIYNILNYKKKIYNIYV
jgi:hypothetical protein